MKKISLLALLSVTSLLFTGCGAFKNNVGRAMDALSTGNYTVTVWSGGRAVKTYSIKNGFVNTEKESDGWFFFVDDKLVRVSGTVTIEQE
jgi:hypothetical protein